MRPCRWAATASSASRTTRASRPRPARNRRSSHSLPRPHPRPHCPRRRPSALRRHPSAGRRRTKGGEEPEGSGVAKGSCLLDARPLSPPVNRCNPMRRRANPVSRVFTETDTYRLDDLGFLDLGRTPRLRRREALLAEPVAWVLGPPWLGKSTQAHSIDAWLRLNPDALGGVEHR